MVAKQPKAKAKVHGEGKTRYFSVSFTEEGVDKLASLADRCGVSRSEFLERAVRWIDGKFDGQLERDLSSKE